MQKIVCRSFTSEKGYSGMSKTGLQSLSPVFYGWHDSGLTPHTHSGESYGRRVVRHHEIEYIVSSRSGYILTEGIPLQTVPGSLFLRHPGMEVEGVGVYRSLFVEYAPAPGKDRSDILDSLPPVLFPTGADESVLRGLDLPEVPSPWELLAWKSRMLDLLAGILRTVHEGPVRQEVLRESSAVRSALGYIEAHYREAITLQQLADAAGYSSFYFCKLFKQVTRLTPLQYVVRYRLEQAKKRMLATDEPLEAIMLETGFRNYGYFWRTFKAVYGDSPQNCRQSRGSCFPPPSRKNAPPG